MIFNSFQFIWLFPIVFIVYYSLHYFFRWSNHSKWSNILLLIISYALYFQFAPWLSMVLIYVTISTYFFALIISRKEINSFILCWTGSVLGLLPLLVFKYYNFISENINTLFSSESLSSLNLAIPVGISFYSFQAIGYLIDVYKKRIEAEENLLDYALFISFFPQILSGPISKASDLLPQIKSEREFDYDKTTQGLKWLLWGFFLKTVMADRLGLYVDSIYNNYEYQSGFSCLVASFLYTFQIYGDFAGYSLMAIGVGRLLGFDLINNFNRPYLATSITEFWKRWHISLTKWLTTYIYIGLGGNRCSKLLQYRNIVITFLVSGIWHGANWTFIIWGILHGIFQCIEKILGLDPKGKLKDNRMLKHAKVIRIIITFVIVNFLWIIFRLPNLESVLEVYHKIFTWQGEGLFLPSNSNLGFICLSLIIVLFKEICDEFFPKIQLFKNKSMFIRWCSYVIVLILILLCGVFDSTQFIYVKF